ncbi:hypothetical protein BS47DRAFT_1396662 [Hydnum rufescens UP504]|uniref:Uncharacterized protein n=1 Tax=Hydnum rufescens UP504 TaxID=1448309 RepID=A0A9P6AQQ8_9AGAM|nr:hypothetical protein BS47DRAFT_1396662 [Hydnum rufescens UP504]
MSSSSTQNPVANTINLQPTAKAASMEVHEGAKEQGESRQSVWGPLRLRGGGLGANPKNIPLQAALAMPFSTAATEERPCEFIFLLQSYFRIRFFPNTVVLLIMYIHNTPLRSLGGLANIIRYL